MELRIRIDSRYRKHVGEPWLGGLVEATLRVAGGFRGDVEMGLFITDDNAVRNLNREYRGVDESTDVLSFALGESRNGSGEPAFVMPPDGILHLGEVVISYPRAAKQASDHGCDPKEELAWLVVHGVLHLLGHDHDEPTRESQMRAIERRVLSQVRSWSEEGVVA